MWYVKLWLLLILCIFGLIQLAYAQVVPEPWSNSPYGQTDNFTPAPWSPSAFEPLPAQPGPFVGSPLIYTGEFRIVNWNAGASEADSLNGLNRSDPLEVANFVYTHVTAFDANVITLQEFNGPAYLYLLFRLGTAWDCHDHWFGDEPEADGVDLRITCVLGAGSNFHAYNLDDIGLYPHEYIGREWWGYTQLDYLGVTITNVHTRSAWRTAHRAQLHEEIVTGIVAGDFNHTNPESSGDTVWFQTDSDPEPTWYGKYACGGECERMPHKIDHVLTVEKPFHTDGFVIGESFPPEGGSNHKMLLTRLRFHGTLMRQRFDPPPLRPRILDR